MGKLTATNSNKYKFYAVSKGRQLGIYDHWSVAEKQVNGYPGCTYQGFHTIRQAENFMTAANIPNPKHFTAVNVIKPTSTTDAEQLDSTFCSDSYLDADSAAQGVTANSTPTSKTTTTNVGLNITAREVQCQHCSSILPLLNTLLEKVDRLESTQRNLLVLPNQQQKLPSPNNASATDFKLAALAAKIDSLTSKLNSLGPTLFPVTRPAELYRHTEPPTTNTISTPQPPKTATLPREKTSRTNTDFDPKRCVVIDNLTPEVAKSLNQDTIRRAISEKIGPVFIDLINRYKHNSPNPKFIVQFTEPTVIPNIIDKWDDNTLLGSTVRKTVPPTPKNCLGMLRGIPLDINDEDLTDAVLATYPGSTIYRLRSNTGTLLRTAKLEFPSRELCDKAVKEGLHLEDHHLLLRVEPPYSHD